MKKIIFLITVLALVFITSCSDNGDSNEENSTDRNTIVINDNQAQLKQRLDLTNSGVISIVNAKTGRK